MVVNVLKRLASQGKTIVCVIHQPRASILPLFSRVLLLGQGAKTVQFRLTKCCAISHRGISAHLHGTCGTLGHTVYYGPSVNFTAQTDPLRDFFTEAGCEGHCHSVVLPLPSFS